MLNPKQNQEMAVSAEVRIDKFLWAVRIFKTRTQASDACTKGRISVGGNPVKPSYHVKSGDLIVVRKPPAEFSYAVKELLHNRVSAKMVAEYIQDLTPQEELDKRFQSQTGGFYIRERGAGRPTKKERRLLDQIRDGSTD
jgi:ribosome-associated heat shock protein Hsp15